MNAFQITVRLPDGREWSQALAAGDVTIGRQENCDVLIPVAEVSNQHCLLRRTPEGYVLVDRASTNGLFLNGEALGEGDERLLRPGDSISLGNVVELSYEAEDSNETHSGGTTRVWMDSEEQHRVQESFLQDDSGGRRAWAGALYQFAHEKNSLESEVELLESAARSLGTAFPGLTVQVAFYNPKARLFETMVAHPVHDRPPSVSKAVAQRVREGGEAVLSEHVATDERFDSSKSLQVSDVASVVAAPLRRGREVFGVLVIGDTEGGSPLTAEDLKFAVAFAGLLETELARFRTHQALRAENKRMLDESLSGHEFLGDAEATANLRERIGLVSKTPATVLITGEVGTGKEVVARAIHRRRGKDLPWVKVNCAAFPEQLVESELFGHERGAFTGADRRRIGKLELASGGILFLDEINKMALEAQAKLLTFLEDRSFTRVGSNDLVTVDVQVLAASNRDLALEVEAERFLPDLHSRLHVVPIEIPPLRDRIEDLEPLLDHFLRHFAIKGGRAVLKVRKRALKAMKNYSWPDNARGLRNLVERCYVLDTTGTLDLDDLPPEIAASADTGDTALQTLEELERQHIRRAMEVCGGNRTQAAKTLGIHRTTLYEKLEKYGFR